MLHFGCLPDGVVPPFKAQVVALEVSFPTPPESPESEFGSKSYVRSTKAALQMEFGAARSEPLHAEIQLEPKFGSLLRVLNVTILYKASTII